jgi:hypothetical protein
MPYCRKGKKCIPYVRKGTFVPCREKPEESDGKYSLHIHKYEGHSKVVWISHCELQAAHGIFAAASYFVLESCFMAASVHSEGPDSSISRPVTGDEFQ